MLKYIGQHIVDLIARFRSDVYLEDISSGTIASGGNLGLDSNNKIVKANEPTSHDAVTLAGTPDYITLSGQEITRNQIDLTADVTGTLPVGNGGTGVTSLGSINISSLNNDSGFTSNTGDITSVSLRADDGNTSGATSGNAALIITGGEGIDTSSDSSATITISGEDASTSNKGVASFNSDNFSVSSGAVSLSTGQNSNIVKQICTTHHCFTTVSGGSSSQDYWVPFIGQAEQAAPNNTHRTVAPYNGLIKKVVVHADAAFGSSAQVRYHKINGGDTDDFANDNSTDDTTTNVTVDLSTAYTAAVANFSSGNTFSAGDQVGVSFVRNNTAQADVAMTIVWEYTIS